ncbi:hypothetical protein C2845_PM05G37210 [Panicum miliaceum]|uniref:J domain-containing protein n=1 Tax=Panicum miliaceum TaxID=4540 RepID=A0A3L6T570_PANMI|nr:hypothetical protein C2845_PM05G37210 [Panicum miliaceum]
MGNKPPPEIYYGILHVAGDASPQGVRAAYRSLARQWHPDKHPPASRPQAEARFKAITEAYELIRACISRALLDQQENSRAVLAAARDGGGGGGTRPAAVKDRGGGENVVATAVARAARSEKGVVAPRTPAREVEPARRQKVYSACSSVGGGGGRRAFAEFSSYVVRKAPPLERRVECTAAGAGRRSGTPATSSPRTGKLSLAYDR